jgi:hypothetical protein
MTDRTFTHVIVYNDGAEPLALTKAEARSTMRSMRNGDRTDVAAIYTYGEVLRQYVAADESATRADKTLRGMWCGGWQEWSAAREELWADRSNAAWAKMEQWEPLLVAMDNAERQKEVA